MMAGVVCVLYNPKEDDIRYIENIMQHFRKVYIYDNSEGEVRREEFSRYNNCIYFANGCNDGLPVAYNWAMELAKKDGIRYLLVLDQDSRMDIDCMKKLFHVSAQMHNCGIVVPSMKVVYNKEKDVGGNEGIEEVDWAINSGSVLDLCEIEQKGIKYDEAYFIDRVDADFCAQIKKVGLSIIRVNECVILQKIGEDSGFKHPNHSVKRHYYISRDRLYYNKKYFNGIKREILSFLQIIRHICLVLIYECEKRKKIGAIIRGIKDYKAGVSGRGFFEI